jgi:hypothetical protein
MEKNKESNACTSVTERLYQKIFFVQKRLAIWLNWKCRHLPAKAILTLLITFITVFSSYFLWLIISAVN